MLQPGMYVCEKHPKATVVMFYEFEEISHNGHNMAFTRELNDEEEKELRADARKGK